MFSLILATYNRTDELKIFLNSLLQQTYQQFELIIADQNSDDRLTSIIKEYSSFMSIIHIRTPKGLSRSRNAALKIAKGDIVAFPDDDCEYTPDLLFNINTFFKDNDQYEGISVRWQNSLNNGLNPMPVQESGELSLYNVIGLVCSISLFFRTRLFNSIGDFEENMGLGSGTVYTVAEDYELALRCIFNGYRLYFKSEWYVLHPLVLSLSHLTVYKKQRLVGDGAAKYVLYKRYLGINKFYRMLLKHVLGIGLNIVRLNKEGYLGHLFRLKGMWVGRLNYSKVFSV